MPVHSGTPSNIVIGAGILYAAPIGTSIPTSATGTPDAAFRQIGYTEEGSNFSYEYEAEDILVAEELDPVNAVTTGRTATLAFQMAEFNRQNYALALNLGADAANDTTVLEPPSIGSEVYVILMWDTEATDNARWIWRKCIQSGTVETNRAKAPDKSLIPVEFKVVLPDAGALFSVYPDSSGRI